jgi:hypothetical protein
MNFHAVWDGTLIRATTWSWGAYVDRLEGGWLTSQEAQNVDGGTPAAWAEETHMVARYVLEALPESRIVDDAYYAKVLLSLDRQLGLAGLRLSHVLNEAYASACPGR